MSGCRDPDEREQGRLAATSELFAPPVLFGGERSKTGA